MGSCRLIGWRGLVAVVAPRRTRLSRPSQPPFSQKFRGQGKFGGLIRCAMYDCPSNHRISNMIRRCDAPNVEEFLVGLSSIETILHFLHSISCELTRRFIGDI